DKFKENTDLARELVEVYRPYIQQLVYTFHASNVRALYATLRTADAEHHPFRPDLIDWRDYWINVHLPGLRRHIFPQLDLHARGRPKSLPRHRSLVDLLDRAADRYGSRVATIARRPSGEQTQTTYRELRDRAHRAALLLATRGIKPGDRVLLIGENSPDWVLGYFAILCAGAIAVPLDQLISAEELAPLCKIAEPTAALRSSAVHKRLGAALADAHPKLIELDLAELARPFILRGDAKTPPAPPERKALASILFTCGMLLPLASGATIVYPLEVDAKTLSRTLADVRPTALIGVPAVWEAVHRRIVDEVEARGPFFHAAFDNLRDLNRRLDANSGLNFGSIVFRQVHSALGGRLRLAVSGGSALPHRVA